MPFVKYIAYVDELKSLGVVNKVFATCQAARDIGYSAEEVIIDSGKRYSRIRVIKTLCSLNADILILRNPFFEEVLFFPFLVFLRLRGIKIVIDMPSPVINVYQETKVRTDINYVGCITRCLLLVISYPWFHFVANRIITYSKENSYFQLGLFQRTLLTGNAVNVNSIPEVKNKPRQKNNVNFIGVASLANWHGYDRMIKSIGDYYQKKSVPISVSFTIVGDGAIANSLKSLAKSCEVEKYIVFSGFKSGEALDKLYENSDIAVGSLGMHRIGMTIASTLKVREYAARGKPFILGYDDIDIGDSQKFSMKIAADESLFSVTNIIYWYKELQKNENLSKSIRNYAKLTFDFKNKIHLILNGLETQ